MPISKVEREGGNGREFFDQENTESGIGDQDGKERLRLNGQRLVLVIYMREKLGYGEGAYKYDKRLGEAENCDCWAKKGRTESGAGEKRHKHKYHMLSSAAESLTAHDKWES